MSDASVASEDKSTDYDLLREVYLYPTERKYQEGLTDNQKRVIRKKSKKYYLDKGEMYFKKKLRGKHEV